MGAQASSVAGDAIRDRYGIHGSGRDDMTRTLSRLFPSQWPTVLCQLIAEYGSLHWHLVCIMAPVQVPAPAGVPNVYITSWQQPRSSSQSSSMATAAALSSSSSLWQPMFGLPNNRTHHLCLVHNHVLLSFDTRDVITTSHWRLRQHHSIMVRSLLPALHASSQSSSSYQPSRDEWLHVANLPLFDAPTQNGTHIVITPAADAPSSSSSSSLPIAVATPIVDNEPATSVTPSAIPISSTSLPPVSVLSGIGPMRTPSLDTEPGASISSSSSSCGSNTSVLLSRSSLSSSLIHCMLAMAPNSQHDPGRRSFHEYSFDMSSLLSSLSLASLRTTQHDEDQKADNEASSGTPPPKGIIDDAPHGWHVHSTQPRLDASRAPVMGPYTVTASYNNIYGTGNGFWYRFGCTDIRGTSRYNARYHVTSQKWSLIASLPERYYATGGFGYPLQCVTLAGLGILFYTTTYPHPTYGLKPNRYMYIYSPVHDTWRQLEWSLPSNIPETGIVCITYMSNGYLIMVTRTVAQRTAGAAPLPSYNGYMIDLFGYMDHVAIIKGTATLFDSVPGRISRSMWIPISLPAIPDWCNHMQVLATLM